MARHYGASTPATEGEQQIHRTTVVLGPGEKRALSRAAATVTAAVRDLIRDGLHLYGLPQPIRAVLERDMQAKGIQRQRDYVVWLLLERKDELAREPQEAA